MATTIRFLSLLGLLCSLFGSAAVSMAQPPSAAEPARPSDSSAAESSRSAAVNPLDTKWLTTELGRRLVASDTTLEELIRFCEARVARLPRFTSLEAWQHYAAVCRENVLTQIVFRGEAARWRDAATGVEWLDTIATDHGYHIRKLRYEALPGLWIPALLYEPDRLDGRHPVVLNVNGHDSKGKAAHYKQLRCINQAKRGMLALNVEWLGMGQLRGEGFVHYCSNQIDLCGTSGVAPFYLAMKRALDLLLAHPHADPKRVAVAGLSGGGWQTIFISSLDTRVTLCNPVAGYDSFLTRCRHSEDLGDSEQTPVDMAALADYTHLTALLAPRPALLTANVQDNCCFRADRALPPLLEAARPIYALHGVPLHLRWHVNHHPGDHNFGLDNRQALYRMFDDFFRPPGGPSQANEIPSDDELLEARVLDVPLPAQNLDFHQLALQLARQLPHREPAPSDAAALKSWQQQRRKKLREIVRYRSYEPLQATEATRHSRAGIRSVSWQLRLDDEWTLGAVEISPDKPTGTVVVIDDNGRASAADVVQNVLSQNQRAIVVDLLYFGEAKVASRPELRCLLISSVGERLLGLQASQLASVVRWAKQRFSDQPVSVSARGQRSSTAALVAAALETAIDRTTLDRPLGSLKQVIEDNRTVQNATGLLCAGLLEHFDLRDIGELVRPRPITLRNAGPRANEELGHLASFQGSTASLAYNRNEPDKP